MSDQAPESAFPQPTEQHAWILSHVGRWNVDCKFYMDPAQPPMDMAATDTVEAHGRFFTLARFEANMMGMPFTGLATMGYDTVREHFVSTWVDTISPYIFHFTGNLDATGKVLEMKCEAPDPQSKQITDWRTIEEHLDDGSRRFEMFMRVPGGPEIKLFTHHYRRA